VRAEVLALRDAPFPAFSEDGLLRVLVTGGSQGARYSVRSRARWSRHAAHRAAQPPAGDPAVPPEDIEAVRQRYAAHEIPADLGTYFENMAERLADAHLFIGRAGASTIAELTAVGRPAILVPLPIATDDHQAANVREMVRGRGRAP
jgi:UDP-N-acetylglucosamine--N-acetylmuramyl-(pentapeptide) pyrophosphoryl-undecaprenol N-acetylglucosamine transferase